MGALTHHRFRPHLGGPVTVTYLGQHNGDTLAGGVLYSTIAQGLDAGVQRADRLLVGAALVFAGAQNVVRADFGGVDVPVYVAANSTGGGVGLWCGLVPDNNVIRVRYQFGSPTGADGGMALWMITGLARPEPIDWQSSTVVADTARSVDIRTVQGGVVIAAACHDDNTVTNFTWTGDVAFSEDFDAGAAGTCRLGGGRINTTATVDDPANTITCTATAISVTGFSIGALSFR